MSTAIDFAVKVLGFTAYRYSHRGQEIWKGDTFQSAATQTDDNGTNYTVRAQRIDNGIDVQRTSGREVMPAGTLPTSHWNVRQIGQPRSSTPRTASGARPGHAARPQDGEDRHPLIDANHYRYSGDVTKDQWFDDRGRWSRPLSRLPTDRRSSTFCRITPADRFARLPDLLVNDADLQRRGRSVTVNSASMSASSRSSSASTTAHWPPSSAARG